MSSAAEPRGDRKLLKPLMEKRRRDRMNRSLDRLRLLLLAATCDERLRNPKVEKAEILQKTVQFLRAQPQSESSGTEELFLRRYRSGYRECLARAARFLQAIPAEPPRPGPGSVAVCPTAIAAGPADAPGRHGLPVPRVGPSCPSYRSYGPGYCNFRPTPGPGLGPTHRPTHGLGYHQPGDSPGCPNSGPTWPSDGPSWTSNGPGCPSDGPGWPSDGPGCPSDRSRCPDYHGYGPGLGPGLGPTSGPSWGPSPVPRHGASPSPGGHKDSEQCRAEEEEDAPREGGGLLGPPRRVWRPWP